jgi:FMN phosphatase YigB (HAD superfamily)
MKLSGALCLFFLAVMPASVQSAPQTIIFDLGDVLLYESDADMPYLPPHVRNALPAGKPLSHLFKPVYTFANYISGKDCRREALVGTLSGRALVQQIHEAIASGDHEHYFKTSLECDLVRYGSELIFIPEKLVTLIALYQDGLEFVKKCKDKGIRIIILSNWDPESFVLVKEKFTTLFELCDEQDIIIPAHVGFVKPETEIYAYALKHLGLDAAQTFFVDDSASNVAASQKCGMIGVVHRTWQDTEQELVAQGLCI